MSLEETSENWISTKDSQGGCEGSNAYVAHMVTAMKGFHSNLESDLVEGNVSHKVHMRHEL